LVVGVKFKSSALKQGYMKFEGKDLNFKRRFSPMKLNSIYLFEFKGRFQMELELKFEWIGVNWTQEYFLKYFGVFL
jgi:hypothetical protein